MTQQYNNTNKHKTHDNAEKQIEQNNDKHKSTYIKQQTTNISEK